MTDLDWKWLHIKREIRELFRERDIYDECMDYIIHEIEIIARKHLKRKSKSKTNKEDS